MFGSGQIVKAIKLVSTVEICKLYSESKISNLQKSESQVINCKMNPATSNDSLELHSICATEWQNDHNYYSRNCILSTSLSKDSITIIPSLL